MPATVKQKKNSMVRVNLTISAASALRLRREALKRGQRISAFILDATKHFIQANPVIGTK